MISPKQYQYVLLTLQSGPYKILHYDMDLQHSHSRSFHRDIPEFLVGMSSGTRQPDHDRYLRWHKARFGSHLCCIDSPDLENNANT